MKPEGLLKLEAHVEQCATCSAANKRVNDLCDVGQVLFREWNPTPKRAELVDITREQYDRLVAQKDRHRRSAERN